MTTHVLDLAQFETTLQSGVRLVLTALDVGQQSAMMAEAHHHRSFQQLVVSAAWAETCTWDGLIGALEGPAIIRTQRGGRLKIGCTVVPLLIQSVVALACRGFKHVLALCVLF